MLLTGGRAASTNSGTWVYIGCRCVGCVERSGGNVSCLMRALLRSPIQRKRILLSSAGHAARWWCVLRSDHLDAAVYAHLKHTYKMTLETWTGEELRSVWATCARRTGPGSPSTGVSVRSLSRQHLARWTQSPRITWHAAGSSSITLRGQSGTLSDAAFSTSLRIPLTFLSAFAFKSNEALVRNHPSSVDGGFL